MLNGKYLALIFSYVPSSRRRAMARLSLRRQRIVFAAHGDTDALVDIDPDRPTGAKPWPLSLS